MLQVDLKNAFRRANRDAAFVEVKRKYPDIWKWVYSSYYHNSFLVFGEEHLDSITGFQQGDPLAPLLFSLVLQPIIERIQAEALDERGAPPALNVWYLDDGTIVGTRQQLATAVDIITEARPERGLHLSRQEGTDQGKLVVWSPGHPAWTHTTPSTDQ